MDCLIGIDLGSTNLKAIAYDCEGRALAKASRPNQRVNPYPDRPEWAIWRPESIWGGVAECLREVVTQLKDPKAVRAVAVTGMGMDGLPIDKDGQWLYPLISWHCPRTEPQFRWWMEHVGPQRQFAVGCN
jgi:sugar (pentulose or hexulose) kinase